MCKSLTFILELFKKNPDESGLLNYGFKPIVLLLFSPFLPSSPSSPFCSVPGFPFSPGFPSSPFAPLNVVEHPKNDKLIERNIIRFIIIEIYKSLLLVFQFPLSLK